MYAEVSMVYLGLMILVWYVYKLYLRIEDVEKAIRDLRGQGIE